MAPSCVGVEEHGFAWRAASARGDDGFLAVVLQTDDYKDNVSADPLGRARQRSFDRVARRLLESHVSTEGFPSGQREQTVNLPALPSKVRILPPPLLGTRGCSSMVEQKPSKLTTRVRFPSPAPDEPRDRRTQRYGQHAHVAQW